MEPVHITDFGCFLGKHSERLVVRRGKDVLSEHPLLQVEQILISGRGIGLSADLVEECCARGIPITFLNTRGHAYARVAPAALNATVRTRREQLGAYHDARGVQAARKLAQGKLCNQANLLRYFGKYCKQTRPDTHRALAERAAGILALAREIATLEAPCVDVLRPALLNREGRAGALYWEAVAALLQERQPFPGREHRGTEDPVNAAFNYGYGVLESQVWTAVTLAGLEPYAGFLHVDRPGRPSLVLDLMEEFRQPAVDRPLLAAWGRGWKAEMAAEEGDRPLLTGECRRAVADRVRERLAGVVRYAGKQHTLQNVIQMQARRLAVMLRGEGEFEPFISSW